MANTSFSAGRDISAGNMVGGNMINSANEAVQKMDGSRGVERETLVEILRILQSTPLHAADKEEAAEAVRAAASDGNPENKASLLGTLKKLIALPAAVGAVDKVQSVIDAVSQWSSSSGSC